jgi:hypothetical protein
MINLLYLDDNNNVIEEIEEIDIEKDYKLDRLYFFIYNNLQSKLNYLQWLTNTSDFQKTYNLNHLEHSANTIYTTSESSFLLMQSGLIEHINFKCKNKIENLFHELKDSNILNVFLEKRKLVIEKKEQLLKIFSECKTLLEILNNVDLLNDLDLIK